MRCQAAYATREVAMGIHQKKRKLGQQEPPLGDALEG
jgi:hypothetical protein